MMLVDTSVWIEHLARPDAALTSLLRKKDVITHPFVIGEIALGSIAGRTAVIGGLQELELALMSEDCEVLLLLEEERLFGTGIGYVDAHLLASARLTKVMLWTFDRRLAACAERLGIVADLPRQPRLH